MALKEFAILLESKILTLLIRVLTVVGVVAIKMCIGDDDDEWW